MRTKKNHKERPQWREFDADTGEFITHTKIQEGATLAHFSPRVLLHENSFIIKVIDMLDKKRDKWLGSAGIRELYNVTFMPENKPLNSFRPLMSILYSLGFVDRKIEGKHTSLYKIKPNINPSDRKALYDLAVEAKKREKAA